MASEVARNAKILKIATKFQERRSIFGEIRGIHENLVILLFAIYLSSYLSLPGTITYETDKNAEIDDAESLKDDEETEGSEDKESEPEEDLSAQVKKIKLNEDYKIGFIINVHILKTLRIL